MNNNAQGSVPETGDQGEKDRDKKGKSKTRSPNYPGMNLEEALKKARVLFREEARNGIPFPVIAKHWKLNPKSSSVKVGIAALLKFGLIEVVSGSGVQRNLKITDRAYRIFTDERENSPTRDDLIKEAALCPDIYREILEAGKGPLPSDANLKVQLIHEKGFNPNAVDGFIKDLRSTMTFARISESDLMGGKADLDSEPSGDAGMGAERFEGSSRGPTKPQGMLDPHSFVSESGSNAIREIVIPVPGIEWPVLRIQCPISSASWEKMLKVLGAMKDALVVDPEGSPPGSGD